MTFCRTGYITLNTCTACPQRVVVSCCQLLNGILIVREIQVDVPSPIAFAVAIVEGEIPTGILDITEVDVGRASLTREVRISSLDQHVGCLLVIPLECTAKLTTCEGRVDTDVDHLILLPLRVAVAVSCQAITGLLTGVRGGNIIVGRSSAGREDIGEVGCHRDLRVTRDTVTDTQFQVI